MSTTTARYKVENKREYVLRDVVAGTLRDHRILVAGVPRLTKGLAVNVLHRLVEFADFPVPEGMTAEGWERSAKATIHRLGDVTVQEYDLIDTETGEREAQIDWSYDWGMSCNFRRGTVLVLARGEL